MTPVSLFGQDAPVGGASAVLSPCRTWRYALERRWGDGTFAMFVGLNPSTADEHVDDPTIRRCIGFAKTWGFGGLLMGNLYAYRATKPADLACADDPLGPDADVWLTTMMVRSGIVVAAWGAHPLVRARERDVVALLGGERNVYCLGRTQAGHPRHPLYLRRDARPEAMDAA